MVDKKEVEDVVKELAPIKETKKQSKPIGYEVALYTNASSTAKALNIAVIEWRSDTGKIEVSSIQTGRPSEVMRFLERVIIINDDEEVDATKDPEKWIVNLSNVSAGALWQNWEASEAKEIT